MFWKLLFVATLCLTSHLSFCEEDEVLDEEIMDMEEDEEAELRDAEPLDDGSPLDDGEPIEHDTLQEEAEEDFVIKPSEDAKVFYAFPKHADETRFPGGKVVKTLIGFQNNGDKKFIVDNVEGSFRYPMDYNYVIQNFTSFRYGREVAPGATQTFLYMFVPSEQLAGGSRTFSLVMSLNYRDEDGTLYTDSPFNETVSVYEAEEGFDTEIFFMYILLAALFALVLFGAQYMLSSAFGGRKSSKKTMETGTSEDIDYDYIPKDHLATATTAKKAKTTKRE